MIDTFKDLDSAIEHALEKSTANTRAHIAAATMTQDDYDKHADALAHHAAAIQHYRNKPENKDMLDRLQRFVKTREYIDKKVKLDQDKPPTVEPADFNPEHEAIKGRESAFSKFAHDWNEHAKQLHEDFKANKDMQALHSHGKRFLAHIAAMTEWHNLQKKGEGTHHQFSAHLAGPELEGNHTDSKYRSHSTPDATDRNKFRTQAITKNSGANWHPGLPELTALEEVGGHKEGKNHFRHPSAGKMKELYPFDQIRVNKEPLAAKSFGAEGPAQIHEQDYATDLAGEKHKVLLPGSDTPTKPRGGYYGTKTSAKHTEMVIPGTNSEIKKSSDSQLSEHFPDATITHLVFAKNLIAVLNPYSSMTDADFGDYVMNSLNKSMKPAEQAAILVEAASRLEKAKKAEEKKLSHDAKYEAAHKQGVSDVLSGKVTPLPLTEAGERTEKPGEKRDELEDIAAMGGGRTMRRSPYAVPADVFTDDTYAKVDPDKYEKWVHGEPNEQDHRNQLATYQQVIRHNPEAQAAHKKFVDAHRELARAGLGRSSAPEEETAQPVNEHKAALAQAGKDLQAGKITPQEFAQISKDAGKQRAQGVSHKAGAEEMTDDEKRVKEADPSYQPKREGAAGKAKTSAEKDLTDIAHGKMPGHMLADKGDLGYGDDSDAQAKELVGGKGEDDDRVRSASISSTPDPVQLINDHPGFKGYLKMKEHLLSHYKTPAVRKYMEDKINQHENNPNLDVDKLAATFHFLHRSRHNATKADSHKVPGVVDRSLMSPEENQRFSDVRREKNKPDEAKETSGMKPENAPATDNTRTTGLKTADPEYKAKLMAEYQAKANASAKPK